MPDIKIKRYADKENLKKLMKYSKDTFATKSETNEKFYTKSEVDNLLSNISINSIADEEIEEICVL